MDGYSKHDNHFSLKQICIHISIQDLPTIIGDIRDTLKKERQFAKDTLTEEKQEKRMSQKQRTKKQTFKDNFRNVVLH